VRVSPSVWPPHTQLLGVGASVRRVGEEWLPKRLLGGVIGSPEIDSAGRGLGTRDTRARRNPHYCGGFLRRRVHRFSTKEVCTSGNVNRGTRGR